MLQPTLLDWATYSGGRPSVSVVMPARNEEETVGPIVTAIRALRPAVAEVIVVDDGSTDGTCERAAEAGARVIDAAGLLTDVAEGPGKGQAMWKGVSEAVGDIVVFCDADLVDFDPVYVTSLVEALTTDTGIALVKGRYERSGTGGRVNELVARPAIELLHPSLVALTQPLGGEYAAWHDVLEQVPFVHGYGVDLGLVLDIADRFGPDSVAEIDLSLRSHRNRPLAALRPQARVVLEVALHRAGLATSALAECPPLCRVAGYERRTA